MESLGNRLKEARESKDISIEQVARETNISRQYIEALENEDYEKFPGEAYLLGFLRNYADYLGLNANEQIHLYKNAQIQEQPVPMEALIPKQKKIWPIILGAVCAVAVLGFGGYVLFFTDSTAPSNWQNTKAAPIELVSKPEVAKDVTGDGTEFAYEDNFEKRLSKGDYVLFDDKSTLVVKDVGTTIQMAYNNKELDLMLGQSVLLSDSDLSVLIKDIDTSPGKQTVLLSIQNGSDSPVVGVDESSVTEASQVVETGSTQARSRKGRVVNLYSSPSIQSFSVEIVFRDFCNLRYLVDGKDRTERYFQKGERLRLDAYRYIMIWASNGGAMMAKTKGIDVPFGHNGEVVTKQLQWSDETSEGNYNLELVPVY
ncbi:helix-turn-helix domain-containing protein [Spirochaeta cellobiosiphila]|uniref:helix-turn-helix domain-containing protein n=1 Tax=Spirochaeta cellobiosiphila TaxID=504483 RepID=UPI000419A1F3|nr:helix-turn-helix domain-containing protein [Spirochaeta cellobiosiphila]